MNSNRFRNLPNIEFVDDKPYYKANKGALSFWKSQETNIDKYAISNGFLVIGSYIQDGEVKYIILEPSEFLCKLDDDSDYNGEQTQKTLEELINKNTKLKKDLVDAKALATRLEEQLKQVEKQSKPVELYVVLVIIIIIMNLF